MIQNKHLIRISFIILFINIVGSIVFYRYYIIEQIILEQTIINNQRIVEAYKREIWEKNTNAIEKLKHTKTNNFTGLLTDHEFINFAKSSINFFKGTNSYINIFDMYGNKMITSYDLEISNIENYDDKSFLNILSSMLDHYFLKRLQPKSDVLVQAFKGRAFNFLLLDGFLNYGGDVKSEAILVSSYIPIIDHNFGDFLVDGLVEIHTDISDQWDRVLSLEKRVLITAIAIFIIFFIIIVYNTNYAQRIIDKQFETNRVLEEAKTIAEVESSAKTEFLANVSHELRTPLNAIIGFSEMMISETAGKIGNAQYQDYIQDINNSGKHLLSVINDILDFSKAAADKLKIDIVDLDLNKLASTSMRFVKPRADNAKVTLIEEMPKEHVVIKADPKRLKQALLNLLSNSVKFTPEGGSVKLIIEQDIPKNQVYIKVIDTGIGIEEKDIPKALSSFGQLDTKLSRKYEGTGLGLPLTKKLIELMNGKFEIQSKLGFGTSVILTFIVN